MCGCAGRDHNNFMVHLIFGKQDSQINVHLLNEMTSEHERLVEVYKDYISWHKMSLSKLKTIDRTTRIAYRSLWSVAYLRAFGIFVARFLT
ncbi:MAG: hypothetical protein HUJ51_01260 [Eggerthellaceae bacterium]|nr:hypothetical protein [Eggerthellaceae bacterium]